MTLRRTTLTTTLLSTAFVLTGICLAEDAAASSSGSIAALRAAEIKRFEANVNADAKVLGELLDDDLEYVHSDGVVDSKQAFIDSLTSGSRDYAAMSADIDSIRILGDVAIIRGNSKVTVIDAGTSRDLHIGYTDVWVWKQGRWQMTAWRSARLPDSPVK